MNLPLAPLIAAVLGGLAALGVAVVPAPALESLVMDSGLPSVIAAAEPPLGLTARIALALGAGGVVAAFMWLSAFVLLGTRGLTIGKAAAPLADPEDLPTPVIRRADAHPDAPPRPPLLATRDLGTPFLEVRAPEAKRAQVDEVDTSRGVSAPVAEEPLALTDVLPARAPLAIREPEAPAVEVPTVEARREEVDEVDTTRSLSAPVADAPRTVTDAPLPLAEQPLPEDFDQPLSAFDPQAIPAVPRPAPVPLAPLRRPARPAVFDETERFEIFELTPPVRRKPPQQPSTPRRDEAIVRPETDASIHALLDRLERGVVTKGIATAAPARRREAERGLEDALVTLRNLARRTA